MRWFTEVREDQGGITRPGRNEVREITFPFLCK